jgi:nitrite reductase/ring-hydroxylating ferredoxin subunit
MSSAETLAAEGFVRVGSLRDLPEGKTLSVRVSGRVITLFHPKGVLGKPKPVPDYAKKLAAKLEQDEDKEDIKTVRVWSKPAPVSIFALDEFCYHEGGPLSQGDIEDWDGRACVKCPFHAYAIDIASGERLLQDLRGRFKSLGIKQRTHEVRLLGPDILVKVSRPSDFEEGHVLRHLPCDRWQEGPFAKEPMLLGGTTKGARVH